MRFPGMMAGVALVVALGGCSKPGLEAGKLAPDFTLADHAGQPVTLSSLKGKVVVLNFWATSCAPCRVEIPWLVEFQQSYRGRGLVVLGVSLDDGWSLVKPYIEEKKINYRVMLGSEEVAAQYGGVEFIPSTFMIDKTGRIAATHVGLISKNSYQSEIETLLDAYHPGKPPVASGGILRMDGEHHE